tara:strand:- start:527 stop:970 length:444 start_codon:yes stop_codon:yes gene_type:complete
MRKKNYRRKRGPVVSKKVTIDGIKFASGLEAYMYKALKSAKIPAAYEGSTYTIFQGFDLNVTCYERCANGKGDYKDRGNKKILPIKYTPDFIGKGFIIETKGRANEAFPMRWKLFKHYAEHNLNSTLYKPQNQKECDETVRLILENG